MLSVILQVCLLNCGNMSKDGTDKVPEEVNASGSELSSLKQQRTSMKRNIVNIQKKVEKDGGKVNPTILERRLQILESYFKQICHRQGQIETWSPNDNARSDLEEIFITAKAMILSFLNKTRSSITMENSFMNVSGSNVPNQSRLPTLKLPRFDGRVVCRL